MSEWIIVDEAEYMVKSEWGRELFFSHDDAKRFYERCVEAENPRAGQSAILFAASQTVATPVIDPKPAQEVTGYEAQNTWPQGLHSNVSHLS